MEAIKEESAPAPSSATSTRSKLRYSLRSANRPRDEKSSTALEKPTFVVSRGRAASNVSRSVSVLDLSGKDKPVKPPRRLSIPAKSTISPLSKPADSITPVSEARAKKLANSRGKSETPVPEGSKSTNRRKFNVISSASYWLTQIKLSESASKHLISIGFFKLALEAGCEPRQRLRDELKLYARRHNLLEFGEPAKELLSDYNILAELEQLQTSETCSRPPSSSDEDSQSSFTAKVGSLKPKSSSSENIQGSAATKTDKKESVQKRNPITGNRAPYSRNSANSSSLTDNRSNMQQKRTQRPIRKESNSEKRKIKNSEMVSAGKKDSKIPLRANGIQGEDKENMVAPQTEEISESEI